MSAPAIPGTRVYKPLVHFDYGILDDACMCGICVDWRTKRAFYTTSLTLVPHSDKDRDDRGCKCSTQCRDSMKARSAYIAVMNRRNLYCESSWHASHMKPRELGEALMSWVGAEIDTSRKRSDSWWERYGSWYPMQYWLRMFRHSFMGGEVDEFDSLEDTMPKLCSDLALNSAVSGAI